MHDILLYIDTTLIAAAAAFKGVKAYAMAKAIASMRSRVRAATKDMNDANGNGTFVNALRGTDAGSGSGSSSSSGSSDGSTGP